MKKVITAEQLQSYRGRSSFCIDDDTILTPSAQDAAREMGLRIRTDGCEVPLKSRNSTAAPAAASAAESGDLVIIAAFGKDRYGILAGLSASIAEQGGNIRDVSQTILEGYFSLILSVALGTGGPSFSAFKERVKSVGESLGLEVSIQKQAIFQAMHRI